MCAAATSTRTIVQASFSESCRQFTRLPVLGQSTPSPALPQSFTGPDVSPNAEAAGNWYVPFSFLLSYRDGTQASFENLAST